MKSILTLWLCTLPFFVFGQTCDCQANFEWTKKTFEENDAGFQYVLDKKGKDAYALHNKVTIQKIEQITMLDDCLEELRNWQSFFRSGHIGIAKLGNNNEGNTAVPVETPTHKINVDKFKKYLSKKKAHTMEGIWKLDGYEIAIQQVNDQFIGSVISAENKNWKSNEVKLTINKDHTGTYFMGDKSEIKIDHAEVMEDHFLKINDYYLSRIYLAPKTKTAFGTYLEMMAASQPLAYKYNATTFYIRIPSFEFNYKSAIDSVILANKEDLINTPNLIIDIRGNGGGSDRSYREIIPLLYTNPIRKVGMEFLSTPHNNQRMLDIVNGKYGELNEDEIAEYKAAYDKLSANLGTFVNLDSTIYSKKILDQVYAYPQNVGIIIDENCGSTAEEFLLEAKQSKKVKLFGKATTGALDVSNMFFKPSPCNEFMLVHTLSKSFRLPDLPIDEIGVQPDIYLDASVPNHQWTEYVYDYLK